MKNRSAFVFLLGIFLLFSLDSAFAADGDLDVTFGTGGIVTTAIGSAADYAYAVAVQGDGKIVAAGYSHNGTDYDFAVARYNTDGSLDSVFGAGGIVTTAIGTADDFANAVAIQSDGKILTAGDTTTVGAGNDIAVVRYNADGSLDSTFGTGGIVITSIGPYGDEAHAIAIQSDGKIVVAGWGTLANRDFAIIRYNADGSLDNTFGNGGIVTTDNGLASEQAEAMIIQSDGKIVVAGHAYIGKWDFEIMRYNADGSLDNTFGTGGIVTTSVSDVGGFTYAVTLQSDGKILAAGVSHNGTDYDIVVVRYNANGSLDSTFGTGGIVTTAIGTADEAKALAVQSDGKIIVAGHAYISTGDDVALVRYNADGSLDSTFGTGGIVTTAVGLSNDTANAMALQNNGKIVVAGGSSVTNQDFLVMRYLNGQPLSQREALIELYESTGGDGWTNNSGWKTPPLEADGFSATGTECSWYGIGCDGSNNVIEIRLNNNNLVGTLPPSIGGFTHIQNLILFNNQLTGPIPPELGNLTTLLQLSMTGNAFNGSIPGELGNLSNLQSLALGANQLTGSIPPELGNLLNLIALQLYYNPLTGTIPPELGNLTNLASLFLYTTQVSGAIPPQLGNLSNLQTLNIGRNQLTGAIPPELANLSSLTVMQLEGNQLSGAIPPELGSLSNLQTLYLYGNQLTGAIPPELGNLSNLQVLNCQVNQLSGAIPAELGNLSSLTYLSLYFNQLSGAIPAALGNLSLLQYLNLSSNLLTGAIPPELGNLSSLIQMILSQNQLSGAIPLELGSLSNLQTLNLLGNQLTGTIPPELGSLSNLTALSLNANQLTGAIPPELGSLSNLVALHLHANQLTGTIPAELGGLSSLQTLMLYSNQLTGAIPPELGSLLNLQQLYLNANQLTGPIPPELGNLSSLQNLQLYGNQLTGPIPAELGNLSNLQYLRLNDNQLTGPVPSELTNLTALVDSQSDFRTNALYTFDNTVRTFLNSKQIGGDWESSQTPPPLERIALIDLYNSTNGDGWTDNSGWKAPPVDTDGFSQAGSECTWFGITCDGSNNIVEVAMENNNLAGNIPVSVAGLSNLLNLNLSRNQLAGPIPLELANLTGLQELYLNTNQLTGIIPPEIGNLANLQMLDLYQNQLTGTIPVELGNLTNLLGIQLHANQLTGSIPVEIGNLTSLQHLYLHANQLSGTIPTALSNLSNLQYLVLTNNQLTGSIPPELGNLTGLLGLELSLNQLTGSIPPELGNLGNLQVLSLHVNQLSGPIPLEFGSLTNLMRLYLHDNQLSGPIPSEFGNLTNLVLLYLHSNQLSGPVPGELTNLTTLTDNLSDLRWNALYTSDSALRTFLNVKQSGGDWESTQTVAPADLAAGTPTAANVPLTWTPVSYSTDPGGYDVYYAASSGGPFALFETINDKTAAGTTVTGLTEETPYYFAVKTFTGSHAQNQNIVYSEYSTEVSATTVALSAIRTLTVQTVGDGAAIPAPGSYAYSLGETVTVTAVPSEGCVFVGWSGQLQTNAEVETLTMDVDKSVTATFNCPPFQPTAESPVDGQILDPGQPVFITTGNFGDPDPGDSHASTYWQVKYAGNVYGREDYPPAFNTMATATGLTGHTVDGVVEGMKYEWRAAYVDLLGEHTWSNDSAFTVGTSEAASVPAVYPGSGIADFKMMTLPYWFNDPSAASILGAPYSPMEFRIGYYDCEVGAGSYVEADDPRAVADPGGGFWVLARNGLNITAGGIPVTTAMDLEVPLYYNVAVGNGWNQIGPPNAKNYAWADIEVVEYDPATGNVVSGPTSLTLLSDLQNFPDPPIDLRVWRWNNGAYEPFLPGDDFVLEAYEAYWVRAKRPNLYLVFRVGAQQAAVNAGKNVMLARVVERAKRWLKDWVFVSSEAIADGNDSPPPPMGGLGESTVKSGGCFIATAAFGSPLARHVQVLKDFRDRFLMSGRIGRAFVKAYYRYSPPIADRIAKSGNLRAMIRIGLLPLIGVSWVALKIGLTPTLGFAVFICCGMFFVIRIRGKRCKKRLQVMEFTP